jgi:DNA-binding LacI/PurR family transcriptional regulator
VQYLQVSVVMIQKNNSTYDVYCSVDERFLKLHGKQKAFFKGGNSSCRLHIRQHYVIYKEKCEKAGIPINHWAVPRAIWKEMQDEKEAEKRLTKKQEQQQLSFKTVTGPREFTRAGVLHSVTELIATNNQVSH